MLARLDALQPTERELVSLCLQAVWQRSQSEKTQDAYIRAVSRFTSYLGRPLRTASISDAIGFARSLEELGLAPSSRAQALAALRSLYRFLVRLGPEHGGLTVSPFEALPSPKVSTQGAPRMLTQLELAGLMHAASPKGRALLLLLATTGLRISEALSATWDAVYVDPVGHVGLRVIGKGQKERAVKLLPVVVQALQPWRTESGPLLPAKHGGSMSTQSADAMLSRIAKNGGVRHVSAHWLRHFLATQALAMGAPLLQVQQDLGHASIATTQRYLHAAKGLERTSAGWLESVVREVWQDG